MAKNMDKLEKQPYTGDPQLVSRVKLYLHSMKDQKFVTVEHITEYLQQQYPEYKRKKRNAFRKSVQKAFNVIERNSTANKGKTSTSKIDAPKEKRKRISATEQNNSDDDSDSFSDENKDYVEYSDTNAVNSLMKSLYKKTPDKGLNRPRSKALSAPASPFRQVETTPCDSPVRLSHDEEEVIPVEPMNSFVIDRTGNKDYVSFNEGNMTDCSMIEVDNSKVTDTTKSNENKDMPGNNKGTEPFEHVPSKEVKKTKKKRVTSKAEGEREPKYSRKKVPEPQVSKVKFSDIGGNDNTLLEVCKLLVHMKHPEIYSALGVTPPRGLLLHGPPGCGKTLMAHAIAGELDLPFLKMAATEIVSGVSGESEEKMRDMFEKAQACAPCILFFDEIDAITQKRENASKDMERRIVSQLLTCMDELSGNSEAHVLVIGATNRPDSIDPALRRAGRFDREISMGIPDVEARKGILQVKEIFSLCSQQNASISAIYPLYEWSSLVEVERDSVSFVHTCIQTTLQARYIR